MAGRCLKIYVLMQVIVAMLYTNAPPALFIKEVRACIPAPRVPCEPETSVPEIPTVMIPLFLLITILSFYQIRRRMLRAQTVRARI